MNLLTRAILSISFCSSVALSQNTSPSVANAFNRHYDVTVAEKSPNGGERHLSFSNYERMEQSFATFRPPVPFTYTIWEETPCVPVKMGRLQYTYCGTGESLRKETANRLQNVVDGILRHYTSHEAVAVNARCIRWLSCGSLYEQSLRHRAAQWNYSLPR